jgi:beta-lactamase regulating signal transducer with metallopeptidase domain
MIAPLLNHLWQSTLCVGVAGLIVLALRRNSATIRFWVWFAASLKFLVPFAALTALGAYVLAPMVPPVPMPTVTRAEPLAKPFSAPEMARIAARWRAPFVPAAQAPALAVMLAAPAHVAPPASEGGGRRALPAFHIDPQSFLLALWGVGVAMLAMRWLGRWLRLRALLRDAVDANIEAPIAVKFSASRLEPGLVGILDPVILLPQGIEGQLSRAELKAVLAHELGHWRRRDNLLAAIHMLVEALFWFFPLVWWVGARLNAEREHACDESVLADGNDPEIYAEGILKICRVYLQSPLACVAGVSGAPLGRRIRAIMENGLVLRLNAVRKCVLSATAAIALALPLALGLLAAPAGQVQAKAAQLLASIRTIAPNAADDRTGEAFPAPEATDGEDAPPRAAPRLLAARSLAMPSYDWSHLLSPVPADLFAANDPPPASAQPASDDSPMTSVRPTPDAPAATAALNDPHPENAQLLEAAEDFCANKQVTSSDPRYLACLDIYLGAHSVDLFAKPLADGSLRTEPTPILPHSTFHPFTGQNALCGRFVWANTSPDEFRKCLSHVFALECQNIGNTSGSDELQIFGACGWEKDRGAEGEGTQHPTQPPARSSFDQPRLRQPMEGTATASPAPATGTCQTPKLMASASLESVPGSDLMTVPVSINGSPQEFLLDLDLRGAMVLPELVSRLSLPNALPNAVSMNGVPAQNDAVAVSALDIGGMATGRATLAVATDSQIARSAAYDGILSGSIFQHYDADINFAGKKIAWFAPTRCADPNQIAPWAHGNLSIIPVALAVDGRLKLQATIRGHAVNAEIDTSSPRTILRRYVAEQTIGLKEKSPDMVPVAGVEDGRHMQVYASTFTQIAFAEGGVVVGDVPVLIQDFGMAHSISRTTDGRIPDLTIGMDVLSHLHMYVALDQGRIYVAAAGPPSDAAPAKATESAGKTGAPQAAQIADVRPATIDELRFQQAVEAREFCMDRNQGPDSPQYGKCVNTYLQLHYDWEVVRLPGGKLVASTDVQQSAFPGMPGDKGNDTPGAWMNNARTVTQPNVHR